MKIRGIFFSFVSQKERRQHIIMVFSKYSDGVLLSFKATRLKFKFEAFETLKVLVQIYVPPLVGGRFNQTKFP